MTDATTADKLAAWKLIEEYGLKYITKDWSADDYFGDSTLASVRSWAEAAGVPWPEIEAVEQFAALLPDGRCNVYPGKHSADMMANMVKGLSVPCVVVMNREGE